MNKYIVVFNDLRNNPLNEDYETIEGETAKQALKNRFKQNFKRLYGDEGRCAEIILVKGYFENNTIHPDGRYIQLCFKRE
ncbi:MAG: hypothetical protein RSF40_01515 [Oscillospiraceae bacterium]